MRTVIVGVIGGIGAGKSTVVRMMAENGAQIVDADHEAHQVLEDPEVRRAVARELGSGVLRPDGGVDRKKVAAAVFADADKLKRLEEIVHPRVRRTIAATVEEFRAAARAAPGERGTRVLVLDVPLLLESPLERHCDAVVFVHADLEARQARVAHRGWSPEELERRESFQTDIEEKRRAADVIVDNGGPLEATRRQVETIFRRWAEAGA